MLAGLIATVLVGAWGCHAPVRTVSSDVHLSAHDWEVACSLFRELRNSQGEAFERRLDVDLRSRMDDC